MGEPLRQRIIEAWASYLDLEAVRGRAYDEHVLAYNKASEGGAFSEWPEEIVNSYARYRQACRDVAVRHDVVRDLLAYRVCRLPSGKFLMYESEEGLLEVEEVV